MSRFIRTAIWAAIAAVAAAFILFVAINAKSIRTATASVSHSVCASVFISGVDPEVVYRQEQLPEPGFSYVDWALHYRVDRSRREVRATVLGLFASRAVYRDGLGCLILTGDAAIAQEETDRVPRNPPPPESTPSELVTPTDARLAQALDHAFAEPDPRSPRWTKAVVVMHDGRIIAERYAAGYGPNTPIWGHSLTKSVINALAGVLVQQGKLTLKDTLPAWRQSVDARRSVTIDQLLRMESGLPFDETGGPNDLSNQMLFGARDMAAFAAKTHLRHPPGTQWGYSNLSFMLLSRLLRDLSGGTAKSTADFIQTQLFGPLQMQSAVLDYDATGTPLGFNGMYASARDWARFGQLYLEDGRVAGQRVLPPGWVGYSASQTLDTGYGAGFWTNLVNEGTVPFWEAPWGIAQAPKDMFYARGYLGQYVVIVPSERLVVARLGFAHNGTGIGGVIEAILQALHDVHPASARGDSR